MKIALTLDEPESFIQNNVNLVMKNFWSKNLSHISDFYEKIRTENCCRYDISNGLMVLRSFIRQYSLMFMIDPGFGDLSYFESLPLMHIEISNY